MLYLLPFDSLAEFACIIFEPVGERLSTPRRSEMVKVSLA